MKNGLQVFTRHQIRYQVTGRAVKNGVQNSFTLILLKFLYKAAPTA